MNLQEFLRIPGLEKYFSTQKYAVRFQPNEYILTPPMFNNIYKGALGEAVGKFILEEKLRLRVKDVPDTYFELFDFTVGDGIYIDFKLWKDTMRVDADKEKQHILEKLEKCGGKRAIIINILYDRDAVVTTSNDRRIVEVPYLYRSDLHEVRTELVEKIREDGYFV